MRVVVILIGSAQSSLLVLTARYARTVLRCVAVRTAARSWYDGGPRWVQSVKVRHGAPRLAGIQSSPREMHPCPCPWRSLACIQASMQSQMGGVAWRAIMYPGREKPRFQSSAWCLLATQENYRTLLLREAATSGGLPRGVMCLCPPSTRASKSLSLYLPCHKSRRQEVRILARLQSACLDCCRTP